MPNPQARGLLDADNHVSDNPPLRPPSTLRFPLHRPRPLIEHVEDTRLAARQTERSQRENESDSSDSSSNSDDSIVQHFASRATSFSRPNYVSPPPSVIRPVATLVELANAEMQQGIIDVSRDFICPILQTIPLDPVQINGVIFEKSAAERYIENELTKDIVRSTARVVRDVMTREIVHTKDGDNSAVTEQSAIVGITLGLTSLVGSEWDHSVMVEINRARSSVSNSGGEGGGEDFGGVGDSNSAEYYAALACRISADTNVATGTDTHQPVYNEELVRAIDLAHEDASGNDVGGDNAAVFSPMQRESSGGRGS